MLINAISATKLCRFEGYFIASALQNRDCLHFQIQPKATEFEKLPFTCYGGVEQRYRRETWGGFISPNGGIFRLS